MSALALLTFDFGDLEPSGSLKVLNKAKAHAAMLLRCQPMSFLTVDKELKLWSFDGDQIFLDQIVDLKCETTGAAIIHTEADWEVLGILRQNNKGFMRTLHLANGGPPAKAPRTLDHKVSEAELLHISTFSDSFCLITTASCKPQPLIPIVQVN